MGRVKEYYLNNVEDGVVHYKIIEKKVVFRTERTKIVSKDKGNDNKRSGRKSY